MADTATFEWAGSGDPPSEISLTVRGGESEVISTKGGSVKTDDEQVAGVLRSHAHWSEVESKGSRRKPDEQQES